MKQLSLLLAHIMMVTAVLGSNTAEEMTDFGDASGDLLKVLAKFD